MKLRIAIVCLVFLAGATLLHAAGPLKVYILAGQSNMQGHAQHLDVRFHGR